MTGPPTDPDPLIAELHGPGAAEPGRHGSYLVAYACLAWGTRLHRDLVG